MQAMDRFISLPLRCTGALLGVLLCGLACLAQSPTPAPSGRIMVGDVLVQGNRLVPTAQIMAQIKTRAGAFTTPTKCRKIVVFSAPPASSPTLAQTSTPRRTAKSP